MVERRQRAEQAALFPLGPLPHIQHHNASPWVPPPDEYLRLHPSLCNRCTETKNMAQMKKKDQSSKNRLSNEEISSLSDIEFKILVIRMLTEMVEYSDKIEEKVKAMKS